MNHWRSIIPSESLLEIRYEDLISNTEQNITNILSHCRLDWNDKCMEFYKTKRSVMTLSLEQVVQPIYKSSIGRWNKEKQWLQPMELIIGDSINKYVSSNP